MNKLTKLLSVFVIAGAMVGAGAAMSGCGHKHAYEDKWSNDATNHWHAATCGHDVKADEGDHVDEDKDNKCDVCDYDLTIAVSGITISQSNFSLEKGREVVLTATVSPENATNKKMEWSSSAPEIISVDANGKVKALADSGEATITATAGGKSATVTVTATAVKVASVTLNMESATVKLNGSKVIKATVMPEDAANKAVTWTSSDTAIATVDSTGRVKGIAAGNVTITAKTVDGEKEATCSVTVSNEQATFKNVTYSLNVSEKYESTKTEEVRKVGIFAVGSNTEVRNRTKNGVYENVAGGSQISEASYTKSIKLGGSSDEFIINAPAAGELKIHIQNGSSGTTTTQTVILNKPDGSKQNVEYQATDGSPIREVVITLESAGEYKITRTGGTSDIYFASFSGLVEDTPLESIEVAASGVVDYYVGQTYSTAGIELNKVFADTLRTEPLDLESVTVDSSKVDMTKAGVYPVEITLTEDSKEYKASINVTVYAVDSLRIGRNAIKDGIKNSYNGIYVNQALRQLYFNGETFSTDGMTVILKGKVTVDGKEKTREFILEDAAFTLSGNSTATSGKTDVTVTLNGTETNVTFTVYVIDKIDELKTADSVKVNVDGALAEDKIGTLSEGDNAAYQFKTIQQAVDFLNNCGIKADASKTMTIAAGVYKEKIEIDIPNLTVIGAGIGDTGYTMIEWDSLFGDKDESGYVHTTDSTSTFNVREKAVGFTMKNVIVSNAYNSLAYFDQVKGPKYSEHRALAMLIQADQVVIDSCKFLGYQDTIEFFTGRQIVTNTYISGTTDFIFGTNNTTYFNKCTIESIAVADSATHGGYVTAFKGNNGSGTKITYGAIFDDCDFICEEGVSEGKTALGRPWGQDAAVMYMNCRLGKHISKTAATGASRDERYVAMSGNVADKAQFTEYNNTGDGAITESQKGVTVLTEDQAKLYNDFYTIFAMTNGQVTYKTLWAGTNEKISLTVKVGTEDVYAGTIVKNVKLTEDLAKTMFAVEGKVLTGLYTDSACTTAFDYANALTADAVLYATYEEADPTVKEYVKYTYDGTAPEKVGKLNFSGMATNGDWLRFRDDNSSITFVGIKGSVITMSAYQNSAFTVNGAEVTLDANNNAVYTLTEDGEVTIKRKAGVSAYIKTLEINAPITESQTIDLLEYDGGQVQSAKAVWKGIEIDATAGKFNNRGTDIQVNNGTVLKLLVAEGSTIKVLNYQGKDDAANWEIAVEGGVATLTAKANTYIKALEVTCPVTVLPAFTVKSDDIADETFTDAAPTNWDANGIIKLYSASDKQWSSDANSKKYTDVNGNEVTSVKRLKPNGASPYIEIDLTGYTGKYTLTMSYAASGSSERTISVTAEGESTPAFTKTTSASDYFAAETVTLEGGKVYKISWTNGYNFYGLSIAPKA